jgi:hypothetical protein
MPYDTLIRGGTVVLPGHGPQEVDLGYASGPISAHAAGPGGDEVNVGARHEPERPKTSYSPARSPPGKRPVKYTPGMASR